MSVDSINFFSNLESPFDVKNGESCRWLGRVVESYFDFGQATYEVFEKKGEKTSVILADKKEITLGKAFIIAMKVLSFATVIIPLLMLIGKAIYRGKNSFAVITPLELQAKADGILNKYSATSIFDRVNDLENKNLEDLENVEEFEVPLLRTEFNDAITELKSFTTNPIFQKYLKEDQYEKLITLDRKLEDYRNSLDQVSDLISLRKELKQLEGLPDYQDKQPAGIGNPGNSCYLNSIVQVISATPSLSLLLNPNIPNPVVERKADESDEDYQTRVGKVKAEHKDTLILRDSLRLLILLQQTGDAKKIKTAAVALRDHLFKIGALGNEPEDKIKQHDAQEMMGVIFDRLKFPLLTRVSEKAYPPQVLKADEGEDLVVDAYVEQSPPDKTHFLQLEVKNAEGKIVGSTLQELVDHHFSEVQGEGFIEKIKLREAPETVLIHLKHYQRNANGSFSKIEHQVDFSVDGVDLGRHMVNGLEGSARYEVVGVVQHSGSLGGGHYTANVKKGSNWYHCDDSTIRPSEENLSENGYVYILKKINPNNQIAQDGA